jgi:hypothetical protein
MTDLVCLEKNNEKWKISSQQARSQSQEACAASQINSLIRQAGAECR